MLRRKLCCWLVALVAGSPAAFGQVAADTMPGPAGFSTSNFYPVSGPIGQRIGWRVAAQASGSVIEVLAPLRAAGGESVPAVFEVHADTDGVAGTLLGSATGLIPAAAPSMPLLVPFVPEGTINLVAGVDYWIVLGRSQLQTVEWFTAASLQAGPHWWADGNGGSYYSTAAFGAFRVTVPSPGTCAVALPVLLATVRRRR